jgi:uncharacterized sporulation protein YeaH/YhbH (DUF444 family)
MSDIPWDLRRRALKDSIRHDTRVKEAIRKNLKELIAEETIITSEGQKLVKLPLRYLDQYRFRFGQLGAGAGQGQGQVGDVIARDGEPGEGQERPGDQPGEQVYEAEISVEELTRLMLEDLALPWLEAKDQQAIPTTTYQFDEIRRKGSMANIDKKRTLLENLKCTALVTQLLAHTAMVGYGEIRYRDEATFYGWANSYYPAWSTLHKELSAIAHPRFITVAIKQKADVYQALQAFLARKDGLGISADLGNAALHTG